MPSFTIKVPNDDEGEDLGEYESDYLPRVGDPFTLWHPRVSGKPFELFCGIVQQVVHEAYCGERKTPDGRDDPNGPRGVGRVVTIVWLVEEYASPQRFCDCTPREREMHDVVEGVCENCGGKRPDTKE
jgi:hypothetical protein